MFVLVHKISSLIQPGFSIQTSDVHYERVTPHRPRESPAQDQ
jgi:hypothetical protein